MRTVRYLITGGSGYIGGRLTDELSAREETEKIVDVDLRPPPRSWPKHDAVLHGRVHLLRSFDGATFEFHRGSGGDRDGAVAVGGDGRTAGGDGGESCRRGEQADARRSVRQVTCGTTSVGLEGLPAFPAVLPPIYRPRGGLSRGWGRRSLLRGTGGLFCPVLQGPVAQVVRAHA